MVSRTRAIAFPAFASALCLASSVSAQEPAAKPTKAAATFAAPVRLRAGDEVMGEDRLFPSPVFHDINGDKLADVVIGDLWGKLTVALRVPGDGPPRYAAETWLKAADGEDLNFSNW